MKMPTEPMKVEAWKWRRAINGRSPGLDHSPDLTCAEVTRYGTLHTVVRMLVRYKAASPARPVRLAIESGQGPLLLPHT
jgi:hypothetical protein